MKRPLSYSLLFALVRRATPLALVASLALGSSSLWAQAAGGGGSGGEAAAGGGASAGAGGGAVGAAGAAGAVGGAAGTANPFGGPPAGATGNVGGTATGSAGGGAVPGPLGSSVGPNGQLVPGPMQTPLFPPGRAGDRPTAAWPNVLTNPGGAVGAPGGVTQPNGTTNGVPMVAPGSTSQRNSGSGARNLPNQAAQRAANVTRNGADPNDALRNRTLNQLPGTNNSRLSNGRNQNLSDAAAAAAAAATPGAAVVDPSVGVNADGPVATGVGAFGNAADAANAAVAPNAAGATNATNATNAATAAGAASIPNAAPMQPGGLGIRVDDINTSNGLSIQGLDPNGAAQRAGMLQGDQIFSINGAPISSHAELVTALQNAGNLSGLTTIGVRRNGQVHTMQVNLGRPGQAAAGFGFGGLAFANDQGGLRISQLSPGSWAAASGLQPNDQITAVNGQLVNSTTQMLEHLRTVANADGGRAELTVMRNGQQIPLAVALTPQAFTMTPANSTQAFGQQAFGQQAFGLQPGTGLPMNAGPAVTSGGIVPGDGSQASLATGAPQPDGTPTTVNGIVPGDGSQASVATGAPQRVDASAAAAQAAGAARNSGTATTGTTGATPASPPASGTSTQSPAVDLNAALGLPSTTTGVTGASAIGATSTIPNVSAGPNNVNFGATTGNNSAGAFGQAGITGATSAPATGAAGTSTGPVAGGNTPATLNDAFGNFALDFRTALNQSQGDLRTQLGGFSDDIRSIQSGLVAPNNETPADARARTDRVRYQLNALRTQLENVGTDTTGAMRDQLTALRRNLDMVYSRLNDTTR